MAMTHALRYREKARELYAEADSATSDELRNQHASLARQYEELALSTESMSESEAPIVA
jgi:hypothetical protein